MTEFYFPVYGNPVAEECIAEGAVPFYRFLIKGTAIGQVATAGANATAVLGVSVPDELMFTAGTAGARTVRTGYADHETVAAYATGVVYVELGSGGGTFGQQVASDASGKAVVYTAPTMSATVLQAEGEAVRNAHLIIQGTLMETGSEGDIVKVNIDRR